MSNSAWQSPGIRKLNLGGGGGGGGDRKMEYLLVGVLALIIVGSLAGVLWQIFGGGTSAPSGPPVLRFKCSKCGHEWEKDMSQMEPDNPEFMMGPGGYMAAQDCPACKEKATGDQMVQCPNPDCKKWYVSEQMKFERRMMMGQATPEEQPPKDICPYCGTDRVDWYYQEAKKRRKN